MRCTSLTLATGRSCPAIVSGRWKLHCLRCRHRPSLLDWLTSRFVSFMSQKQWRMLMLQRGRSHFCLAPSTLATVVFLAFVSTVIPDLNTLHHGMFACVLQCRHRDASAEMAYCALRLEVMTTWLWSSFSVLQNADCYSPPFRPMANSSHSSSRGKPVLVGDNSSSHIGCAELGDISSAHGSVSVGLHFE